MTFQSEKGRLIGVSLANGYMSKGSIACSKPFRCASLSTAVCTYRLAPAGVYLRVAKTDRLRWYGGWSPLLILACPSIPFAESQKTVVLYRET